MMRADMPAFHESVSGHPGLTPLQMAAAWSKDRIRFELLQFADEFVSPWRIWRHVQNADQHVS